MKGYTDVQKATVEALVYSIGKVIGKSTPEGMGFALLMFDIGGGGRMFYASSADRNDMHRAMMELILNQRNNEKN